MKRPNSAVANSKLERSLLPDRVDIRRLGGLRIEDVLLVSERSLSKTRRIIRTLEASRKKTDRLVVLFVCN